MMYALKFHALTALLRWFGGMRPAMRQRAGAVVGWLARTLARPRVRVVRRNLALCFPDETPGTREAWLRAHFRALGQSIVDRGVLWYGTPEAIRDMVGLSGYEHITQAIAQGRRLLVLAPHFIGLDAAATRLTMEAATGATMYTPQSDPAVDAIVRAGRARFNDVHLVSRRDGAREMVRHLRDGRPLYYLPDMDFGRNGSIFAPFFNIPAATLLATAQLARKWEARVIPVIDFWNPDTGRYEVEVLPPMEDFPGQGSLEEATALLNQKIESWVRRCPSQYYWVHRRFKTRPQGEAKLY